MADDASSNGSGLPPKLNLRKQGILKPEAPATEPEAPSAEPAASVEKPAAPAVPERPATARLEIPPEDNSGGDEASSGLKVKPKLKLGGQEPAAAAKPEAKPGEPADSTHAKRKTSRIPLDKAKQADDSGGPKTIKIKPAGPVPKLRSTQQLKITSPIGDPTDDAVKRKTSRIELDEVLNKDTDEGVSEDVNAGGPKTIKIKRPSEAGTVKLKRPPKVADEPATDPADDQARLGETARIDGLDLDEADVPKTQKKTIKVKRPAGEAASPVVQASVVKPMVMEEKPPDQLGIVSMIASLAAMLVLGVVIYVLLAQAIGPDLSLTRLSSYPDGPELSWPGRIPTSK